MRVYQIARELERPHRGMLQLMRELITGATLSGTPDMRRCNVSGPSDGGITDCDVADAFVLDRFLSGGLSSFDNVCADWLGP